MTRSGIVIAGFCAAAVALAVAVFGTDGILGSFRSPFTTARLLTMPAPASDAPGAERTAMVRLPSGKEVEAVVPMNCDVGIGQDVELLVVPSETPAAPAEYRVVRQVGKAD